MKKNNIISALTLASACLYGMNALANETSKHIIGLDILKSNFAFKEQYGKKVFKDRMMQYMIFGQYNLSNIANNFFLEYGYGYMNAKNTKNLNAGEHFYPGDPAPNILMHSYSSKIKQQFPYLGAGWNYHISKLPNTYISVLGGLSIVKINGWFKVLGTAVGPLTPAEIADSKRNFAKTKPAIILKAAINHKFTDHFGVRLSTMWQQLSHFKIHAKKDYPVRPGATDPQIRLKNYIGVGLGVFYNI